MILCISGVLTLEELNFVEAKLDAAEYIDGKATAGWHARLVKQNTQLPKDAPALEAVRNVIHTALSRNTLFQMAVRPKVIRPMTISRYKMGMSYGTHIDNALMSQPQMRSDVSMTLFLSDPSTYDGGELVVESTQAEQVFKLEAGSMIIYPSSTLHRVEPIRQGVRLVAVSWIQSLIRDPNKREILFELDTACQNIFAKYGKTAEFDLISKTHANLLRQWIEL